MNIEKFTMNSSKRIQEAQDLANKRKNSQILPAHLLYSMLKSDDSLVKEILLELWVDLQILTKNVELELNKVPTVDWNYQLALSNELNNIFIEAEKIADRNKDQFVTEEHLLLALIDFADTKTKEFFSTLAITSPKVKEVIDKMRGWEKLLIMILKIKCRLWKNIELI